MEQPLTTAEPHRADGRETPDLDDEPDSRPIHVATAGMHDVDARWLRDRLHEAVAHLHVSVDDLSVVVLDDAAMGDLHEQYTGVAGTTDVLTFDLGDDALRAGSTDDPDAPSPRLTGEIYICMDEASRQAEVHGHAPRRELLLYAVHGLLHLLGYDDQDPGAHRRMHAKEDAVLTAIGVGATFAPRDPSAHAATATATDEQA